uniref:KASH domain-containing protein n=1 Tax=Tetraodon nigroviridis TaxID=99883 RepID=H3C918_TETNG
LVSQLEELETALKEPGPGPGCTGEEHVEVIKEWERALRRWAGRLGELSAMEADLAQYVAAGDSALLEQQLEQLQGQWDELCTKVSSRRQEIADRLSAWTIFKDKNKEFCDWLSQMEDKTSRRGDLSIEEMVEKLKKDCMEEINLFSENKSHLKQLGEQLLLASDGAKQAQVRGSLLEVNQRWHSLFHHIDARVKKLKETLATAQQLDQSMSRLRWWLSGVEAQLSRPVTYSVCHHQEIQKRLAEQQELQRDIQQHAEGVESVLGLCDLLLRDEDAAGGGELGGDSVQETSRSLDQRWRTICALALDRRLRIEETWRLWCKFLDDYARFEDWLKMAERTAANPNSADVPYTVAKEELKKFEGLQRQVLERLTQLELVNNQYRRLARENRTDRASQLKAMVHGGNRRWDALHRRVAAIVRRLKFFTSQREEFEGTRDSLLVWLTELDLQLTNVEHFSESDVHHKIQQLNSFQKEIALNTERIDALIVFGEGLIQKSLPQDAALMEDQLEELHTYCQEVFSRLVRFHQRLSQPPLVVEEPELSSTTFDLETSLELVCRPRWGRSFGSLPATPTHLLASPLERSGRETPLSVDSLPLEWDHTGDVGGSSTHEDEEEEERAFFSALSGRFFSASSTSVTPRDPPTWQPQGPGWEECEESSPTLTSTPHKQACLGLMCERGSSSAEDVQRLHDGGVEVANLFLGKISGVSGCRELLQAESDHREPRRLERDLDDIASWLQSTVPALERMQQTERAAGVEDLRAEARDLREVQKMLARHQPLVLRVNRLSGEAPGLRSRLGAVNRAWSRACALLQQWDASLRKTLANCQEFHESLHSLLLWLDHAERRCDAASISQPDTPASALQDHRHTLQALLEELQQRQARHTSLQLLWSQLQPEEAAEDSLETREKIRVTGSKLRLLLKQVDGGLGALRRHLVSGERAGGSDLCARIRLQPAPLCHQDRTPPSDLRSGADAPPEVTETRKVSLTQRLYRRSHPSPPPSLLRRLLPCLIPLWVSHRGCAGTNNFARSFHPMLRYTNGPPPT